MNDNSVERAMTAEVGRRHVLRGGMTAAGVGVAMAAVPGVARAHGHHGGGDHHGRGDHGHDTWEDAQVARIHELESTFHGARTHQDIDVMRTCWDPHAVLTTPTGAVLRGWEEIRGFFLGSPAFAGPPIMTFAPTYKGQVDLRGWLAEIYFECHDTDFATGFMTSHLFLAGTVRNHHRSWRFWRMTGGLAPMSADQIYYP